jgi:predicted transcriptional regulator
MFRRSVGDGVIMNSSMELHLSAEKEALVHEFAARTGRNADQVIEEALDRMMEYDARFTAAVEEGLAEANRGDLLDHGEVVERIERIFRT